MSLSIQIKKLQNPLWNLGKACINNTESETKVKQKSFMEFRCELHQVSGS